MSGEQPAAPAPVQTYHIKIQGHLDRRWSDWLEGLALTHEPDGTTTLSGPIADQPALHGLLIKIRDLGLELISVVREERR